jgi:hypothetical protein
MSRVNAAAAITLRSSGQAFKACGTNTRANMLLSAQLTLCCGPMARVLTALHCSALTSGGENLKRDPKIDPLELKQAMQTTPWYLRAMSNFWRSRLLQF